MSNNNLVTKQQCEALIDRLALHSPKCKFCGNVGKNTMQPILIGDVFEETEESLDRSILDDYWRELGTSKSLQQIVEESGWIADFVGDNTQSTEFLQSPKANALFSSLINTTTNNL